MSAQVLATQLRTMAGQLHGFTESVALLGADDRTELRGLVLALTLAADDAQTLADAAAPLHRAPWWRRVFS